MLGLIAAGYAAGLGAADLDLGAVYAPRRVAVAIGIDDYDDPALEPLRFAAKDAEDMAAALRRPGIGGFDRVWVLTDPEDTTAERIAETLALATADLQRDDTFLLYLSGHGTLTLDVIEGTRLWFLPSDGSLSGARETGIAVSELERWVAEVPARRRVLVMDTCFNGRGGTDPEDGRRRARSLLDADTASLLGSLRGEAPPPSHWELTESEVRLYAAREHQPALEAPELQNGVYTHFLLQAMERPGDSDLNGDGLVDVAEAHSWAWDHTVTYTGGMQTPQVTYSSVGPEPIYLSGDPRARSRAERALLAATDALLDGARVLVDGVPRGVLPEVVPIEPGRRTVEVQDSRGRTLVRQGIRLAAGETVMADDLLHMGAPGLELSAGAALRSGPGAALHPSSPELELTWLDPLRFPWLAADLHLRSAAWRGPLGVEHIQHNSDGSTTTERIERDVSSGVIAAGAGLGWRATDTLSAGAVLDVARLWQQLDDYDGVEHSAGSFAPVLGPRLALRLPVGRRHLSLRYDFRAVPYRYGGEWTAQYEHGLALGLGTRR